MLALVLFTNENLHGHLHSLMAVEILINANCMTTILPCSMCHIKHISFKLITACFCCLTLSYAITSVMGHIQTVFCSIPSVSACHLVWSLCHRLLGLLWCHCQHQLLSVYGRVRMIPVLGIGWYSLVLGGIGTGQYFWVVAGSYWGSQSIMLSPLLTAAWPMHGALALWAYAVCTCAVAPFHLNAQTHK